MPLVLPQRSIDLRPDALPDAAVTGLYVHIPFCFHKCHYCDFYSITRQTPQRMDEFVGRILAEADRWIRPSTGPKVRPETIFFGGGTPSLLPLEAMARLIRGLRERFDCSRLHEWTIEANPATVTLDYCRMLHELGVDRLSFGAQSFDRADLAALERHHDPDDVPRSVELARQAGYSRLNVDLIYAIPGQTLESWRRTLDEAIALKTPHLSCYGLTYEPNTPIAVKRRLGQLRQAEETLELQMLRHTRQNLSAAGIDAYEISNFAIPGEACRHNLMYWTGGNYIGLGPSAASHVTGWRWRNRPHLREWEQAVDATKLPAIDVEHLSPARRAGELAMLMLRLTNGIEVDQFRRVLDQDPIELFHDVVDRFTRAGLLRTEDRHIRLTDAGLPVADALASEFLAACE